jgi:hypothetical protein
MTTALLVLETALLALLALFVVALLRSHAEILRRLAAIERRDPEGRSVPPPVGAGGERARDIAGQTLAGDAVKVSLRPGSPRTLLGFLTSGCSACGPLWESLRDGAPVPAGARLVIVAKGPEQESAAALRELAPAGRELLMSTEAWRDYAVPASPHFVLVDGGSGRIAGRGTAGSWERIVAMVEQAVADAGPAGADAERAASSSERSRAGSGEHRSEARAAPSPVRTTSERAERAELALAAAGIGPGHASLYPADTAEPVDEAVEGSGRR